MITRRELIRALTRAQVGDWVVIERVQEIATLDELRDIRRSEHRTRTNVVIHHDVTRGRGTIALDLTGSDGNARSLIDQAITLATTAIGPAWQATPPSAPAKVDVLDKKLGVDLDDVAASIVHSIKRPDGGAVLAHATVLREQVFVQAKNGFHDDWPASELRAVALVTAAERSLEVMREARRVEDLAIDSAVATAAADLRELAGAGSPVAGPCDLVLTTDALLHGDGLGVWQVFEAQADSVVERQGLARYRVGTPIAPGAEHAEEPLSITSDGALDYAIRSAPVGNDGDAVRRFPIIEGGRCVGLGMSMREAALRQLDPNGGVRNLVVSPGTWNGTISTPATQTPIPNRIVEVRRLRALSIDPLAGDASLEISLGVEHTAGGKKLFRGGTVRLDLVAALARARRSSTLITRGAYRGPTAVLLQGVELIV